MNFSIGDTGKSENFGIFAFAHLWGRLDPKLNHPWM